MSKMWDGRAVYVRHGDRVQTRQPVTVRLTEETAGKLSNALRRLEQQFTEPQTDLLELRNALDYVMVGDPASSREHRRMEASKGMDPAESTPPRDDTKFIPFS